MTDTRPGPSLAKPPAPSDPTGAAPGPDTSLAAVAPPGRERRAAGTWTVYVLLAVILVWIWVLDHGFAEPPTLMAFVKKAAPLLVLAAGQYFVIVAGEFDLSVGSLVGAQVVIAAQLLDGDDGRTVPVLLVMVAFGLAVGLVNGLVTTYLKVPSFITTLGMMLVLFGAIRRWTGGAPTGELSERFRTIGRGGIDTDVLDVRQVPWSVLIAIVVGIVAVVVMRSSFGRTLVALGDNPVAARFSAVRVERTRIAAFVVSSLSATLAGVLIGGFGGLTSRVGDGLEFTAITAVVLGGVVLGGGRGSVLAAMAGGLTLEAVFRLFRQFEWETTWQPTAQGVIIIAAVAYASWRPSLRVPTWPWNPTTPGSPDPQEENHATTYPRSLAVLAVLGLALASACTSDDPDEATTGDGGETTEAPDEGGEEEASSDEFFVQEDYDRQLEQRDIEPEGDAETPWLQAIEPEEVETSEFALDGAGTLCFSNASVSNPWRQTGWITMQQQVELLTEEGVIDDFQVADAADDDNKQISDIEAFVDSGDCDALIISPSTTATLTPAVEAACESGIPVIVFDRGVNTDCMVTFIHPIGGYAYGADGAEFLVDNLEPGSTVLALRILPGVDVLENRWAAAQEIFGASDLEILGDEFTEGDGATIKDIVTQYLEQGDVDGIWMDAGDGAVSALEAFEDAGVDYPVFVGEDELSFMRKWDETGITAIAPVYSNFQWRTPVLAAQMIWEGEPVPSEWVLPQDPITEDDLGDFLERNADLPALHYAKFGGEDLPGYPDAWEDR